MFFRRSSFLCLSLFAFTGCGINDSESTTEQALYDPTGFSESSFEETGEIDSEFDWDRADKIRQVETKRMNWDLIPAPEKAERTTTGKIVYQSSEGRMIVSHYENGSPRFVIRQFTPGYAGKSSSKLWTTNGVQEAWTPSGMYVRFFADDLTPFGAWVLRDTEGQTRAEIVFENSDHTGELEYATFPPPGGGRPGVADYNAESGEWFNQPEWDDRVKEVESVVKMVREFLRIVDQL